MNETLKDISTVALELACLSSICGRAPSEGSVEALKRLLDNARTPREGSIG